MDSKTRMMERLKALNTPGRLVASTALNEAFEYLQREIPEIVIHEYATGETFDDWEVPQEWDLVHGELRTGDGKLIASSDEHYLFVAPYSESVDTVVSLEELKAHTLTREDVPDAFYLEHRLAYTYGLRDWRITLPHDRYVKLAPGDYHVRIDAKKTNGKLCVAEYFKQGETDQIISFTAHIDEICNDDLSGCTVALELVEHLKTLDTKYSYQVLLVPELFGSLFYCHRNRDVIAKTVCSIYLEVLGAGETIYLKNSLKPDEYMYAAFRQAFADTGTDFNILGFFEGYGNDERVYSWPTMNIPGFGIQRFPFTEYHTSKDSPEIIDQDMLMQGFEISKRYIDLIESDYVPSYRDLLPPWLSKRKLYFDASLDPENFQKYNNHLLFSVDGKASLLEISAAIDLPFEDCRSYLGKFVDQGLVQISPKIVTRQA